MMSNLFPFPIFQQVHETFQHRKGRSSLDQTEANHAMAAEYPWNGRSARTSSVFSTSLGDFETTPENVQVSGNYIIIVVEDEMTSLSVRKKWYQKIYRGSMLFFFCDVAILLRKQIRRETLRCPWVLRQYLRPQGE